ncbi:MAG: thiol oxidoreductase [Roseateles depolymerans]|uniref:Thiol oxidoreductase n=1 Tax=Roseateles depolymerans TaxID=76731 RepID=A0A2W5FD51_9BURK|nr:MAG: thiol oxidoreductase [Roseateles depolymerans]
MKRLALRNFSTQALPCAIALLIAGCGGGSGGDASPTAGALSATAPTARALAAGETTEVALTPVTATASGAERGDLGAAAAIDHNMNTRWGSAFDDNQFLTLDYGKSVLINRVHIEWENAHATQYLLQVSDDGVTWRTIKTVTNSAGGSEDLSDLNGQGRYLRMQGVKRSTQYGYSIFEIQAFSGTPATTPDPTTPTDPGTPQTPTDPTQPGALVKPVTATSSAVENNGNSALQAIDGNPGTRWASAFDDGAWIQFDFGAKTPIGYMKLLWENAYGKEYKLLTSDDGQNWTQLRYVTNGKGGTEEFYNLGANARYVRLQGVARATNYGYSLYEVQFKSPGSDNSLPTLSTTALAFPPSGANLASPPAQPTLETVQFTLPDGTLVTRFGMLGRARHARERGEDWNEIGFGVNETVDASGKPQDKGPGNYLTFVPNYFKNRTWGVEFIDNSRVAGVTKPTIVVNQYYLQAQKGGGHSFFRRFDDPGVTGYGWMSPGDLLDDSTYTAGFNDVAACPVVPKPPQNALMTPGAGYAGVRGANDGCSVVLDNVPGHSAISANANGVMVPNGSTVPSRVLKLGDAIEFTGSFFSTRAVMDALGDNGGYRYYTNEVTYVVGTGLRPWYGVQPRLMNAPLPDDTLQGGLGSVSYDYADNSTFIFQQPTLQIGMQNMQRFVEGRRWIHTNMWTGDHNEPGNDRNQAAVGLQGAHFNQSSCFACHVGNGRSLAPSALNQRLDTMAVRTATLDANGQQVPHPTYGMAVQMNARSTSGAPQDWGTSVRVAGFDTKTVTLADGTAVTLSKPKVAFDGPTPAVFSLRSAQPMIGMGLLEAVPDADILARVRSTPDEDGVKGVANFAYDPETGAVRLGRYGWKASKVSLRHQAANAALLDMSVTSPVYPNRGCLSGKCTPSKTEAGLTEDELTLISRYVALLAVPAQRSMVSGFPKGVSPLPYLDVNPTQVATGAKVFQANRCTACHVAEMKTGSGTEFAELRNQKIKPYTDLLLHDMGPDLADKLTEGQATGSMWRTSALWGIGYTERVAGDGNKVGYLHDGRARTLTEAIMWHGGEATASRKRFESLTKADRDALLAFLGSL